MKEITLKVKDIKQHILVGLRLLMEQEGFQYGKTNNEFVWSAGDYKYMFIIPVTSWSNSYSISVHLYITQKRIEDVFETILGRWRHQYTCNQPMIERIYYSHDGRINGKGESMTIWLYNDNDINNAIETLKSYYEDIAKPYFGKFNSLRAFDNYINNPPFEYSPAYIGSYTNERCMKGLIVAKLVGNPNYDKLVAIYDQLIKKTVSDVQPDSELNYNKVKDYLEHNPIT